MGIAYLNRKVITPQGKNNYDRKHTVGVCNRSLSCVATVDDESVSEGSACSSRQGIENEAFDRSRSCSGCKKQVSFGDCEVRHYIYTLGEHPMCSSGPPVSILVFFHAMSCP